VASGARRAGLRVGGLLAALWAASTVASTWSEDFASGRVDPARWQRTSDGNFRMQSVEVVPSAADAGFRLRIEADTRGTRDDTVKHLGVASRCAIPLGSGTRMQVRMDWGPPANGSYLAGSVVLSPHATTGDPRATGDWLSIGYVGVPPGRNARLLVTARVNGVMRTLFADGWPDANRQGRLVGRTEIAVTWRGSSLEIREDGQLVHTAAAAVAPFESAYVYLQLASHSNFPARAIHFESLRVGQEQDDSPARDFPAAPECRAGDAK
jgi:hypothetical protein